MRCYDGCWDSEAQALFKEQVRLLAELKELEPQAHCTYFPYEGVFQVHVWGRPLSGFHTSRIEALRRAINGLIQRQGGAEPRLPE